MQVRIDVETDTYNTYPNCQLIIELGKESEEIYLKLSDNNREISVDADELIKALQAIT